MSVFGFGILFYVMHYNSCDCLFLSFAVTNASVTSTSQPLESTMEQSKTPLPMSPTPTIEVTMAGSSLSISTSDPVTSTVLSTTTGKSEPVGKCSSVNPKVSVMGSQNVFFLSSYQRISQRAMPS